MDGTKLLIVLAVVGGLLALVAGAALSGSASPTYNVAVDETGPAQWEDLSPEAKTVVQTALPAPGSVTATFAESGSYENNTTAFGSYPYDLPQLDIDQTEPSRMVIERDGTVLVLSAEIAGDPGTANRTVAISVVDRTDSVRIQRENLSPHARTVIDVAAANGSAAFYTDRPPALEEGLDVTPNSLLTLVVSNSELFVLADDDAYRTVVVSSPTNWVPLGPALTPTVVLGSLATVPAVALFGSRRVGWSLATVAGVAVAVLPVVTFRIVTVGPSALLVRRLQEMAHLVVLPAIGALVCVAAVRGWRTDPGEPSAADDGRD